jgi:hypothetical protein
MATKFTISVKVNRIFFERYEAPCGEPETDEIRKSWEFALIEEIEKSGYDAKVEYGVGHDPTPNWYLTYDGNCIDWSGKPAGGNQDLVLPGHEQCEECEDAAAQELWIAVRAIVRNDAGTTADVALQAGDAAAQALSDLYVAQSEAHRQD